MHPHDTPKLCECGCGQPVRNRFKQGHNSKQPFRTVEDRFWRHVQKSDGCWLWTSATNHFGYGMINSGGHNGKAERAHRVSWVIHNGPIPEGMFVCHTCDNPSCVNPAHLFLGTPTDNNRDMQRKGRMDRVKRPKGERHGMSKLTAEKVLAIRVEYATGNFTLHQLGSKYGVSYMAIWSIVKRHTWKHI